MDNNNLENWEKELKNKLGNHQEPTDAKDLDVFMDKLEDNNFFGQGHIYLSENSIEWTQPVTPFSLNLAV